MILVISPLKSIIEDQLQEMELLGYHAKDLANLSDNDIRQCNFKIVFATTEKVKEPFQAMLMDSKSKLHQNTSHDRDMNRKKTESSNLFFKASKDICVATRDLHFYKLAIEMQWDMNCNDL